MTDIADRLARLSKRDELAKRAQLERGAAGSRDGAAVARHAPFRDVVEAAGRAVRRYPGMSIVLTLEDGGIAVRVAEKDGEFAVEPLPEAESGSPSPAQSPAEVSTGEGSVPGALAAEDATASRSGANLPSDLADLLRRNPDLMAGWPGRRDPPEG
jgi:hypothetical protein